MSYVTIRMTKEEAYAMGLVLCSCGYPKNSHFLFGKKLCAHNTHCTGYKETARVGKIVKRSK